MSSSPESAPPEVPAGPEAGWLRRRVLERTRRALEIGALRPLRTTLEVVEQGGVAFAVRILESLARKEAAAMARPPAGERAWNPFLPPDPDLLVGEISPAHVAVLNKYPVIEEHLLLVTRAFEDQTSPLGPEDFHALLLCLGEIDGLCFYNGGTVGGASQRHKHLQLVPRALGPGPHHPPIEALIEGAPPVDGLTALSGLPFRHAFSRIPLEEAKLAPPAAAAARHERYRAMLRRVGLEERRDARGGPALAPYNLLVSRRWMLLVPRAREDFEGISINALGFAGALLARDAGEGARLRAAGPMRVLAHVAVTER